MPEKISYDIPNIHQVIKLLANVYSDPRDALTEFIINSLDADARNIQIIVLKGKVNQILIKDDGVGMDHNEMNRIVKNIGNSIKANPEELKLRKINAEQIIGHMGIGILGYQSFCRKAIFISKQEKSIIPFKMILDVNNDEALISITTSSKDCSLIIDNHKGTTVTLFEIDKEIMKLFSITLLKKYLEKNLSGILRRQQNLRIYISDTKNTSKLEPLAFSGIPFSINTIETDSGKNIKLDIYIQATGSDDNIRVSTKGKVVIKEISR